MFLTKGIEIFRLSNFENNLDCAIDFYFVFNWKVIYCMKKIVCSFFVGSLEWKLNVCWCFDCYQFITILSCLYKPSNITVHKTLKLKLLYLWINILGISTAFNAMLLFGCENENYNQNCLNLNLLLTSFIMNTAVGTFPFCFGICSLTYITVKIYVWFFFEL